MSTPEPVRLPRPVLVSGVHTLVRAASLRLPPASRVLGVGATAEDLTASMEV